MHTLAAVPWYTRLDLLLCNWEPHEQNMMFGIVFTAL